MKKTVLLLSAILIAFAISAQNKFIKKAYVEYDFEFHNPTDGTEQKKKVKVTDMKKIYLDHYTEKTLYNKLRKQHFTFRINDIRFDIPKLEAGTYPLETASAANEVYWLAPYYGGQFYQQEDFLGEVVIEKVEGNFIWGSIKALKLWPLDINNRLRDKSRVHIKYVKFCVDKSNMYVDSKRK